MVVLPWRSLKALVALVPCLLKRDDVSIRGIEIAANHVKGVRDGFVYAKTTILHKGRTTQLWQVRIVNEADELVSLVKFTTITLPKA